MKSAVLRLIRVRIPLRLANCFSKGRRLHVGVPSSNRILRLQGRAETDGIKERKDKPQEVKESLTLSVATETGSLSLPSPTTDVLSCDLRLGPEDELCERGGTLASGGTRHVTDSSHADHVRS